MMRFVVKVMNNGNVDHLPVKAINMKEAIQKAKSDYKVDTFLSIMEREEFKRFTFGQFGNPITSKSRITYRGRTTKTNVGS